MTPDQQMAEVRKASRLLGSYYRRVVTLLRAIDTALVGYTFEGWTPTQLDAVGASDRAPFWRWGWEFLPWYDASFVWAAQDPGAPITHVVVRHVSDSGYVGSDTIEPEPGDFPPVAESETFLEIRFEPGERRSRCPMCALRTRDDVEHLSKWIQRVVDHNTASVSAIGHRRCDSVE